MNVLKTLWHKLGSPRWFYQISQPWTLGFGVAALLLLGVGAVWGLAFAPQDYQQGNSVRIMYVHVPVFGAFREEIQHYLQQNSNENENTRLSISFDEYLRK